MVVFGGVARSSFNICVVCSSELLLLLLKLNVVSDSVLLQQSFRSAARPHYFVNSF